MTDPTAQDLRLDYLRRLDAAISEIPHGLAVELRAGIAEELRGDDARTLSDRIHKLGSPEEVARAAIEAGFGTQPAAPAPAAAPPTQEHTRPPAASPAPAAPQQLPLNETRGYAIISAIVLGAGSFVVPFVGWIVGVILVLNSKLWSTRDKIWALSFPLIALVVTDLVSIVGNIIVSAGDSSSTGPGNPLVPSMFDLVWSSLFVMMVVTPLTAVWLIFRLRK